MEIKYFGLKQLFTSMIVTTTILSYNCRSKTYEPTYATDTSNKRVLVFGVQSQSFYEMTDLFVKYLNEHLTGVQVQAEASSRFLTYIDKLDRQRFDLTIVNGVKALETVRNGYSIVGQVIEEGGHRGAILANKDSSIRDLSDLKNKTVGTPGKTSFGGYMMQALYLAENNINAKRDIKLAYLESFESVVLNIYLDKCSSGFCTTNSWDALIKRRPELTSKVELKWMTPPITGNALILRKDLGEQISKQLTNIILSMHSNEQGRKALEKMAYLRFEQADSNSYGSIKKFLKDYNAANL